MQWLWRIGRILPTVFVLFSMGGIVAGQDATDETATDDGSGSSDVDKTHAELTALREKLIKAVNEEDIDAAMECLHEDVVLTAQHGERLDVSRGREGVRKYFDDRMTGENRVLKSYQSEPTVDELTILHGDDTGISYGSSIDHYTLLDGTKFDAPTRWTATLVREDGQWYIASLHVSENLFDNPVLTVVKSTFTKIAIGAGIGGFVLGLVCMYVIGRLKR